ncbi:hypothetical protein GH714_021026 [Hevea brasiliensis]|uniref:Legume lectin domain-containing protein n=1 Tax=Hevea brasiliensis TaxID=3981 RepID=A0A6A6KT82_HEVBR|nr:hypothetical protein GH714_021026 [Hevea brasiliensis]
MTASFFCRFSFSIISSPLSPFGDDMAFLITSNAESFSLSDGNHVGIYVNTFVSFASVDAVSGGIDLKNGRQITAWIEYNDANKLIQVWVSYSQIRPSNPVLEARVDFRVVDHWRFKTYGYSPSITPMEKTGGGDGFMCYPEESGVNGNSNPRLWG